MGLYYHEDSDVVDDPELQDWVGEIFTYAVLGNEKSGTRLVTVGVVVMAMVMVMAISW